MQTPRYLFCNTCTLHILVRVMVPPNPVWTSSIEPGKQDARWPDNVSVPGNGPICQSGSALGLPLCMALGNGGCGPLRSQGAVVLTTYLLPYVKLSTEATNGLFNHIVPGHHLWFFPYVMAISDCHRVSVIFCSHAPIVIKSVHLATPA